MRPPRAFTFVVLLALALLPLAACARRPEPAPTRAAVAELTIPATDAAGSATVAASATPVFATAATASPTPPTPSATNTATPPAPTPAATTTVPAVPTNTATVPPVPTSTATDPPIAVCVPRHEWPVYTVQRGDTLFRIAQRTGSSVAELSAANCLANPNVLPAGTRLFVPRLPQTPPTPTTTATVPAPLPWASFSSATIGARFSYPAHWTVRQAEPFPELSGVDGFVRLDLMSNPQDIEFMTSQEAFNGLYGTNPFIEKTTLSGGGPARIIRPSAEVTSPIKAALITYMPAPVFLNNIPYNYLMLTADTVHFYPIVNTLQMPPTPPTANVNLFNASAEPLPGGGRRITFTWDSSGATRGSLVAGTTDRQFPLWPVLPRGQMTVELSSADFPNPIMTLSVWNDVTGHQAQTAISVDWPCAYDYFFVPAPAHCPAAAPLRTTGVYQPFEHGFMIWLQQPGSAATILTFFDTGRIGTATDFWTEGVPESDPSLVPPPGLFQPARGFGKVWREDADLRARLGWATAPEQSYEQVYQAEARSSLPGVSYVTRPDAAVLHMTTGVWYVYLP